jgi:hypothetical protein
MFAQELFELDAVRKTVYRRYCNVKIFKLLKTEKLLLDCLVVGTWRF